MKNCMILAATICLCTSLFSEQGFSADAKQRKISVSLQTPASNYSIKIQSVYQVGKELWVISQVRRGRGFGATVITKVKDTVNVSADKKLVIKHKVFGKTWGWGKDTKELSYLTDLKKLQKEIKKQKGKRIYQLKVIKKNKRA